MTSPAPITLEDVYRAVGAKFDALEPAIRWGTDLQRLALPAVLVPVPTMAYRYSRSAVDASFAFVAIVQNTDRDTAIRLLSDLVESVQTAIGGAVTDVRQVDVTTADGSANLLAAELLVTLTLAQPKGTP